MNSGRVRSDTGLNLRQKPNGKVLTVLSGGEEFSILDKVSYFRVKTKDGTLGYVHGSYIEEFPSRRAVVVEETVDDSFFPSAEFELVEFSGDRFIGKKTIVDKDFVQGLSRVNTYATECGVQVYVTSSLRNLNEQVRGAIVPPASRSCHHVGHAIDMNLMCKGTLYNSKKLSKTNLGQCPKAVQKFIQRVREDQGLRWGGDFSREDPVHIDDNLFRTQETIYLAKLNSRVAQLNA